MGRWNKPQRKINVRFIDKMMMLFRSALRGGVGTELTYRSGRFNAKAFAKLSTKGFFARKSVTDSGKPKIALIIDCSGSMVGAPISGAAHLAFILSQLHEANVIEARIFCSGNSAGAGGGFQVPLPQPQWVWEHLMSPHGREFLSQTFIKFRHEITECDLIACYTDADISDRALKPSLWRKHGVSCVGLYQGDVGQIKVMQKYFDYSIARERATDLFTEYLRLVRKLIQQKV